MATPGIEPLVLCDNLSIAFPAAGGGLATVVDSVSFQIGPGEALGIVGESGSGKSTLARALLGYCRAGARFTGGRLMFAGTDLTRADNAQLRQLRGRQVVMVPQNPLSSLTYHMPVGEQVVEVLRQRAGLRWREARARMLELLAQTGLADVERLAARYPHQLSGGQRQRVVIASALACRPQLLVLDEPTTALDKTTEAQVLALVAALRASTGVALALVSHDLNVVAGVCETVMVMKDGRLVEQGPVGRVFDSPATPYARQLLGSVLRIDSRGPPTAAALPVDGAPAGSPLLSLQQVGFAYPGGSWWRRSSQTQPALQQVTLQLGRGEVLGVIGESGSGKTTLGMLVAGMMPRLDGRMLLDDAPLPAGTKARSGEQRRRIQMIFQDPLSSLNPRRTVGSALVRPLRLFRSLDRQQAQRQAALLLGQLGMDESYLERFPRQLSGGQQQRVAIARAFAANPDLLVCDEITSALDASVQSQLLEQLQQMQRQDGAAMLLITHDLSVVWKLAPRVVVIQGGQIIEQGDTAQVFSSPATAYTAGLLEAATRAGRFGH